jgi:enoyl-CoA hydratase/carnithine racemase
VADWLSDLEFEVVDGVAVVTLSRPDHRNAFSAQMGEELGWAYSRCDADDAIRAVVVTGAGDAFCAGADLTPAADTFASPREPDADEDPATRPFSSSPIRPPAWEVRKPVIAAVNGHAIGLGMTIALQADIRIMATGAKYGIVHVRRGVIPDAQSHWTVPRAVGFSHAAELMLTGRHFTAEEAVSMGMASRALPPDEVLPAAMEVARDIAVNTAPVSVAISKKLLWSVSSLDPVETEYLETLMHHHVMGRDDAREGVMAFLERRDPKWTMSVSADWPDWPEWPEDALP